MYSHNFRWVKEHDKMAREILSIVKISYNLKNKLPQLPICSLEWIKTARPVVEGKERSFTSIPFWEEIYKDNFPFKMIVGGRQIYKSTYTTDILAFETTSSPGVQACYVTFDQPSMTAFSKQKLQIGTFSQNPILAKFPRNKLGSIGEISLKNGSTIYCTTDNYQYKHVEGKSLSHCILDEAQYQDIEHIPKVIQTMMATKGKLTVLGIGGEAGSPYEQLWEQTDQREWIYDDPDWRSKLQFDANGLVIGKYLVCLLKGRWVAQKPENDLIHGYHLPQTIFATIPFTVQDAKEKYKVHPMYSIEYQQKNNPEHVFQSHTLGNFYKADRRPITPEMVWTCINPHRYVQLLNVSEIAEWKEIMGDRIKVSMGVDFGSGNPSNTVISIIIEWKSQKPDEPSRYQLAYIDKRPQEDQMVQAEMICKLFQEARCDIGVGDLGYGANQIKLIQDGGFSKTDGHKIEGVSHRKFIGCRTIGDETKPYQKLDKTVDEHGTTLGEIRIDKTTSIQELINTIGTFLPHPVRLDDNLKRPQFMIPDFSRNGFVTESLVKDFTSLTRKDLERIEMTDPRQKARKEFNHPKDSVMSIIYAFAALKAKTTITWFSV